MNSLNCRQSAHKSSIMGSDDKKVLLLGAGMVSGPFAKFYGQQNKVGIVLVNSKNLTRDVNNSVCTTDLAQH